MSLASYHCSTPGSIRLLLPLAPAVSLEQPRGSEFAELVADHVFRHVQLGELPAVVNQEGHADELGDDGAIARPRLQRFTVARALVALDLGHQALIDVRTFLQRPAHRTNPSTGEEDILGTIAILSRHRHVISRRNAGRAGDGG